MRLIDADALGVGKCSSDLLPKAYRTSWNILIDLIKNAPTIDAVPVVRCKDCIFARPVDEKEPKWRCVCICREGCTQWVGSDDYCSYGERRNNG